MLKFLSRLSKQRALLSITKSSLSVSKHLVHHGRFLAVTSLKNLRQDNSKPCRFDFRGSNFTNVEPSRKLSEESRHEKAEIDAKKCNDDNEQKYFAVMKKFSRHRKKPEAVAENLEENFHRRQQTHCQTVRKNNPEKSDSDESVEFLCEFPKQKTTTVKKDIQQAKNLKIRGETSKDSSQDKEHNNLSGMYNPKSVLSRRRWINTSFGEKILREGVRPGKTTISVMSYNVLAQDLIVEHPYLYKDHHQDALCWSRRHARLMEEISYLLPEVLCLQEVQSTHLHEYFEKPLLKMGYEGAFKKRTGNKIDGCAIFWQAKKLNLLEKTSVEFCQPGIEILNRDNVALALKLGVKNSNDKIVVATTHLLFNRKRSDIRLAQVQILLAELDRLSHTSTVPLPIILTGDFNFQPSSSVYRLLSSGKLRYDNLEYRSLLPNHGGNVAGAQLIPRSLGITDCCRHALVLNYRKNKPDQREEIEISLFLKLYHSEKTSINKNCGPSVERKYNNVESKHRFSSGTLRHDLGLKSAYHHSTGPSHLQQEASTHQDDWVTVDYIFYSMDRQDLKAKNRRRLSLLARWRLPNVKECQEMGCIPNFDAPSDHLPLVACFLLS